TSQIMFLNEARWIRHDKLAASDASQRTTTGVDGDPTGSTAEMGRTFIDFKVNNAVAQIQNLLGGKQKMARRTLRVYIENWRDRAPLYQITPGQWRGACVRHRALARKLDASIGWDDDEERGGALAEAEIVIGVPSERERLAERAPALRWVHHTSAGVDA